MHQGKILKSLIDDKGLVIIDFVKKLGISRQTMTNYFRMESLKDDFIEKVCKEMGIKKDIFYIDEAEEYKAKYIEAMQALVDAQKKIIELEEEVKSLYKKSN